MTTSPKRLAILAGGGPAPGINSVIVAAAIRAQAAGIEVLGIQDGFKWLMKGDINHAKELHIEDISRRHYRGGSFLGIARDNPTKDPKAMENAVNALLRLNVGQLITIGGDDTAFSSMSLAEASKGRIHVVHVPKTIDNDLDLPHGIPTFGYNTARHVGVEIVKNLMVDAQTTSRWYFVVAMGRKAGHLALGIGKAVAATTVIIPEEFPEETIRLKHLVDILAGAILKRQSYGRQDGVAVLAEGLVEHLEPAELDKLENVERDDHGHIRIAEVDFGRMLKQAVVKRLAEFKLKTTIVEKNVGYELRCADPISYDMEYARDLGYYAAKFLVDGGTGAMVSIQNGRFVPLYFADILDPKTKKTRVRMVDVKSEGYAIARQYMLRLNKADFEDGQKLASLATTCKISLDEFRAQFYYLIEQDAILDLDDDSHVGREAVRPH
ncbi:MAG TPA: diphosphate--fructose-6-phosphate 1-phosphotransferase [Myxococcota bacterium]|nr:diphosphate--fructose-6-phosphate 1-phosphotransferase [Myxococcota bacterium]HRY95517.1 diphosphate--fructose-6-phosphate 1-phosphotransferase [Myxococcota bacterium]